MQIALADQTQRTGDLAKLTLLNATVRGAVVRVVEQVEHLGPELKLRAFKQREVLRNVKVDILEAGTKQVVSHLIALGE
jgi:hypothetical protein